MYVFISSALNDNGIFRIFEILPSLHFGRWSQFSFWNHNHFRAYFITLFHFNLSASHTVVHKASRKHSKLLRNTKLFRILRYKKYRSEANWSAYAKSASTLDMTCIMSSLTSSRMSTINTFFSFSLLEESYQYYYCYYFLSKQEKIWQSFISWSAIKTKNRRIDWYLRTH